MTDKKAELAVYKYQPTAIVGTRANLMSMLDMDPKALSHLLPRGANLEQLRGEFNMALAANPAILQCTQFSMGTSIAQAFLTGLHIAGPMCQASIIPRKKKGVYHACFEPEYRGLVVLAHKSDKLRGIQVGAIYANDKYKVDLINGIQHEPLPYGDRGVIIGYYTVLEMLDGAKQYTFMRLDEIEAIKGRSSAARSGFSPWTTDYDEMAKKTVLKRALKVVPVSTEELSLAFAVMADNDAMDMDGMTKDPKHASDIIDGDIVQPETAEDGDVLPEEYQ